MKSPTRVKPRHVLPAPFHPRYLGKSTHGPAARIDCIPWHGGEVVVTLHCEEFTALCPVTGQPDYGTLTISYAPREHLVESKSLKLYLWRYRERGIFNEALVAELADDLLARLKPQWIEVSGHFRSRGGIAITALARRPAAAAPAGA